MFTFGVKQSTRTAQEDPFNGDLVLTIKALVSKRSNMVLSSGAMSAMGAHRDENSQEQISVAVDEEGNYHLFINNGTITGAPSVKLNKNGTFSDKETFNAFVEKFNLNTDNDNHLNLEFFPQEEVAVALYRIAGSYSQQEQETNLTTNTPILEPQESLI